MKSGRRPAAIVYGRNPVREALLAGTRVRKLLVAEGLQQDERLREIIALAGEHAVELEHVDRRRLDDVAHTQAHQGVVAYVGRRQYLELDDLLAGASDEALVLVLDGIQDPQNLGSICRSAEAAGVAGVVFPRHRATEVTPAVAKASAGAVEYLQLVQVAGIPQALERLKKAGFWVVGLAAESGTLHHEARLTGKLAVVVGAEDEGLHRLAAERCDQLLRLPMLGRVTSLNAAAATVVVLYEALRQRQVAG
ncbi:MAG TPA: 23S rRNA (guanosine(2251)-2'-O)-methyltransferase RlmB [Candidatus Dormibacteraeota bacterium]|nr:23S rRNA (guanosine(2251)-2'-O)-methyltransferase RlmB [Candidatus Dormibacteraeota bacterium]